VKPVAIENPILNSPFEEPGRHYRFDDDDNITDDILPDIKEGMTRQQIDAAIARHADTETLYDQPYEDKGTGGDRQEPAHRLRAARRLPRRVHPGRRGDGGRGCVRAP
jgi:hypothetical protein